MSERALSLGIAKHLRTLAGDTDGSRIGYQPDMKPPPASGQWYISIGRPSSSRGPASGGDVNDRVYNVQVCLTLKLGYAPMDRHGHELANPASDPDFAGPLTPTTQETDWMPEDGMLDFADKIAGYLIESYATINAANTFISGFGGTTNGFVEPFHQVSIGDVQSPGASWCYGEGGDDAGEVRTITISCSGARRIRARGTL